MKTKLKNGKFGLFKSLFPKIGPLNLLSILEFVAEMNRNGKLIGAICHGGWVLISANILKGKQVTSVSAIKDDMINAGALWLDKEVVFDDNLVTSRKPDDLPIFCKTLLALSEKMKH
jgi:protease I